MTREEVIHNARCALQAALWHYDFDVDSEPKGSAVECIGQAITRAYAAGVAQGAAEQRGKDAAIARKLADGWREEADGESMLASCGLGGMADGAIQVAAAIEQQME